MNQQSLSSKLVSFQVKESSSANSIQPAESMESSVASTLPRNLSGANKFNTIGGSVRSIKSNSKNDEEASQYDIPKTLFVPWNKYYEIWRGSTIFWSLLTIFFDTYQVAFATRRTSTNYNDPSTIIETIFTCIFSMDILINFNLVPHDSQGNNITSRCMIAKIYVKKWFWIDLLSVVPFYMIILECLRLSGYHDLNLESNAFTYLGLIRLLRLLRLHRVVELFIALQYSSKISLMTLTFTRNFGAALIWTHFSACVMYFIARLNDFHSDSSWIDVSSLNEFDRYITTLYWSIVTFTTVGYGDFSPVNSAEKIWGMIYMLINMAFAAWVIGSITLLIVKTDEKMGLHRENLQTLDKYTTLHNFDISFKKKLKRQLKLDFKVRGISDEQVLHYFPSSIRRKVLRRLYMRPLMQTNLLKGVRQQFVDALLAACHVEIFSPDEDILFRGNIASELYLVVEGVCKLIPLDPGGSYHEEQENNDYNSSPDLSTAYGNDTSLADSDLLASSKANKGQQQHHFERVGAGAFVNDIGFFTESPQPYTVRTSTVVKTLTMSRASYKAIADDHPASVSKCLHNLLAQVKLSAEMKKIDLPRALDQCTSGSEFVKSEDPSSLSDENNNTNINNNCHQPQNNNYSYEIHESMQTAQFVAQYTAVQELIKRHINKQKDDHVTRFLFAASRDDCVTISHMCDQGFDPNSADYDSRTALMVASMKGHIETVNKLLEHEANPNIVDMHGTSALREAVNNGQDDINLILLRHGGSLCMTESQAASTLCQAVFDGDIPTLRRLLRAGIQVNAGDYDKRTAAHIAASEANLAAIKVLVDEFHADLGITDRWNNTAFDEAQSTKSKPLIQYLNSKQGCDSI